MTTTDDENSITTEFGALVETADGSWTIRHVGHGQDFHSSEGARFEAWQLYVVASGLLEDLKSGSVEPMAVLDVGMGLGYNACATVAAWIECAASPDLALVSLEIDPRLVDVLASGKAPWTRGWDQSWRAAPARLQKTSADTWLAELVHPISGHRLTWQIIIGDASQFDLKNVIGKLAPEGFRFIWQDPFTPELNPAMWSFEWFSKVLGVAASGARLMTYSVSRLVKDALEAGGWIQERFRTPGKKRHWLRASPR